MPRIDPLKLLTCLKDLLEDNGGIRSENEVKRIAGLMGKYSKKLVSKCIYVQILKCTNTELLGQFMGSGGWNLTHMWLSDSIPASNWPLVQEILELLLLCPVDVERLKSNTAPKLVKGLCTSGGTEAVRILATKLVEQWLKIVTGNATVVNKNLNQNVNNLLGTTTTATTINAMTSSSNSKEEEIAQEPMAEKTHSTFEKKVDIHDEQDPLALTASPSNTHELTSAQKKGAESGLVYKMMVKDGKQILAKIENTSTAEVDETVENSTPAVSVDEETRASVREEKIDEEASNKENEKKNKDSEPKESKEVKEKEKSKSSSSSSRDKDKKSSSSHKSSSSSSGHKSSSSSKSSSSRSKSSSHRSSTDSKSSRDKERSSDKDRSDRHKSSKSSSSSSKDKDRSSRDKVRDKDRSSSTKDKEREKIDQAEKDKETLSKVTLPSIDKMGKIPKKPRDESETVTKPTSITIPSKKASMSIEIRRDSEKTKTVKTYKAQFRSHGLNEEAPPPPSRKGLKKPTSISQPGTAIPSSTLTLKRSSPPPSNKDSSSEKKAKIDINNVSPSPVEKPGAIKLIAPKPKPILVETNLFADALSASMAPKKDGRKRKRGASLTKDSSKEGQTSPPESPVSQKVAPLKFYQDTLDDSKTEEKSDADVSGESPTKESNENSLIEDDDDIPLKKMKEDIEEQVRKEMGKKSTEDAAASDVIDIIETDVEGENEPKPPGPGCGPNGPPGVLMLHRRKGPKKKLQWRPQEQLEEIRFFELDENERVNVTKTFTDMKQMERTGERDHMLKSRKICGEDIMVEQTPWMPLILVDDVPPHPEGSQSKEKKIQSDREMTTLKALYFSRAMIPDTPGEPDMEQYQMSESAVIPIDDITGNPDAVTDFTSIPWPDPKGSPPHESFMNGSNEMFPNNGQFNPFMQFPQNGPPAGWGMGSPGGVMQPNGPVGMMPPVGMMGPNGMIPPVMGGFNNMNMPPLMNGLSGPNDILPMGMNMNMNMNMINGPPFNPMNGGGPPQFGPGGNFGPGPGNFGPPNMNGPPNEMSQRGGRGRGGNNNGGGSWRTGSSMPPFNNNSDNGGGGGGGGWRPAGPGGNDRGDRDRHDRDRGGDRGGRGNRNNGNWTQNPRICKQFMRGNCRNIKCNFIHKRF